MADPASRALVLSGGGLACVGWEIGLLSGLATHGVDVRQADLILGTSAGSIVGTLLRLGTAFEELYERQLAPVPDGTPGVKFEATTMMTALGKAFAGATGQQDARARVGALALQTSAGSADLRRAMIGGHLGGGELHDWPPGGLAVTAVDTADGALRTFTAESGVPLLDAVCASCAVPTVWSPVPIEGHQYMDGGMRSPTNADLATGYAKVLVLALVEGIPGSPMGPTLTEEVATLREAADVHVVLATEEVLRAFGTNPLSPTTRRPAALAGRAQADTVWQGVADFWHG